MLLGHQQKVDGGTRLPITNIDQQAYLERMARTWTQPEILAGFRQTNLALWQLAHNANTRLVLEVLFLTYPFQAV